MDKKIIRIGTRESELAVWQATTVKNMLQDRGYPAELVFIKSEGDINLVTPLYELGVQGIFTKSLDIALLSGKIDIAVHSMKDAPTQMARGIVQAAVLPRASHKDIFVPKPGSPHLGLSDDQLTTKATATIGTSSIRRTAQWLHRYPADKLENLRGNVNTRLRKVAENDWAGAIFAAAGLERIGLRPADAIELDWMLPAPAQGAILVVCRADDEYAYQASALLNHQPTEICTAAERDFLRALMGGCSVPIGGLATINDDQIHFKGNIVSKDGKRLAEVIKTTPIADYNNVGKVAAAELLANGGQQILDDIKNEQ